MRHYHRKEWQEFRKEVIELDGGKCVRCRRYPSEGAVLQVHHKEYLPGKLPWHYPYQLCETLCKGCHASEHGVIAPFTGWECVGYDDLGSVSGECELCGTSIRHVFFVQHAKWPSLEVGEICCDHLTVTTEASEYINTVRRREDRRRRFIQSNRWKSMDDGTVCIQQKDVNLKIEPVDHGFRLVANAVLGKRRFSSVIEAKEFVFKLLEDGQLETFLKKVGKIPVIS